MGIFGKRKPIFDSSAKPHFTKVYQIAGKKIVCSHCDNDQFDQGTALLNTPGMTFMGLDWANRAATVLSCRVCGKIEWFLREPQEDR